MNRNAKNYTIADWKNFLANNRATEIVEKDGVHYLDKTPLLSFSRFTRWSSELGFANIPHYILENARNDGVVFMETLQDLWINQIDDWKKINWPNVKIKAMIKSFIDALDSERLQIIDVERHITNGYWHGYIDVVVKHRRTQAVGVVEIKTRSSDEVRETDKLQCGTYANIIGCNYCTCYVAIVNKNTFETKLHKLSGIKKSMVILDKFLAVMGKEKYMTRIDDTEYTQSQKAKTKEMKNIYQQ